MLITAPLEDIFFIISLGFNHFLSTVVILVGRRESKAGAVVLEGHCYISFTTFFFLNI